MKGNFVKLYDTVQISKGSVERFSASMKDNLVTAAGRSLRVSIIASHSGRITRNYGFYLPMKMRDGAKSLLEPFPKPILLHHNELNDPIGRITNARYVDTSGTFTRDSKKDDLIKRICDGKTPFHRMIDLVEQLGDTDLLQDPNYPGLGHILVDADITDSDAIQKLMDGRYMTVSIGATTDKAVCSICKTDWVEEGRCEHIPGKKYEDKLCVVIAGALTYDEISFVNSPADPLARVVTIGIAGGVHDSVTSEESSVIEVSANFSFQDSVSGGNSMEKLKEAWEQALAVASSETTEKPKRIEALKNFLETNKDVKDNPYRAEAEKLLATLETPPVAAEKPADAVAVDKKEEPAQAQAPAKKTDELTEAEQKEADEHYEDMVEFGYALSLFDEDFEDAKLTPEKRKSLSKGTFCKPGRKYPVPDCSHARVAMAYAKKYNEAASVLACIRRKASALGCPFTKDGKGTWADVEKEIDDILADLKAREVGDKSGKTDPNPKAADMTDGKCGCEALEDQVKALQQELKDTQTEAADDEKLYTESLASSKKALADAVTRLEVLAGGKLEDFDKMVNDASTMKIEDLMAKAGKINESLDLSKAVEKLNDGMSRKPTETVTDPTASAAISKDPTLPSAEQLASEQFTRIRAAYKKISERDPDEADAYLVKLRNEGLIPDGFDPKIT